ncbi:MAG: hypothetical protein IKT50_05725 [Clostridia bacterium]|nr:hypothetical protein [Clostridia bacterium]
MKRILSLICLLAILLSTVSCSSGLEANQTAEATPAETKEEAVSTTEEEEVETGPIVYPEGFSVGYARIDITPDKAYKIYNGTGKSIHDPLMMTCTAVCDGESAALLYSIDTKNMNESMANGAMKLLNEKFGIPADRIMLNVTHTHNAPDFNRSETKDWVTYVYEQMLKCTDQALRDLDPAEAYVGKSYTDGITFVRRYLYETTSKGTDAYAHESEADNEMRTIRFDRKNKKDVLMVNYQTHYGGATSKYKNQYSADFIDPFRKTVEKDLDMLFVYYSGASGNLNFQSELPKEKKYADFVQAVKGLMITAKDALAKEEKVETGKIISASSMYPGKIGQDTPERIAQAQEIMSYPENSAEYLAALGKYGMASREAEGINRRSHKGETVDVPFSAITFGEIGFAAAPDEMFDTNGKEVRDGSPFKSTFVLSYTNGGFGYVPSALAFPNKGYEVYITWFEEGSAEEFSAEMVRLLNLCNDSKN